MAVPRRILSEKPRGLIRSLRAFSGFAILASDGRIGDVDDFYFDDVSWTIRYFIVNTGGWLTDRQVLISPSAVLKQDWEHKALSVDLTREQVEKSPGIASDAPVSKQHQLEMYKYYGWTPSGEDGNLGAVPPAVYSLGEEDREKGDPHLRSCREVIQYRLEARNGSVGHVDDFLVDDQSWVMRFIAVDTRDWIPAKKVLLAVSWITKIEWASRSLSVELDRKTIEKAPTYSDPSDITNEYEERLFAYYNAPGLRR